LKWDIVVGAPTELLRALEDILEDELKYRVIKDVSKYTEIPGISNVAQFKGILRGATPFRKRRWSYVVAGVILIAVGMYALYSLLSGATPRMDLASLVVIGVCFVLVLVGGVLISKSLIISAISLGAILEGEAYQANAIRPQAEKVGGTAERYSLLSTARLTIDLYLGREEPPREVMEKATADLKTFIEKTKQVLPKFELPVIELPRTKP